mmetsp:Transcript_13540/g.17119  ORF Transcript_13540/g.17119 Transcript_13540/m.17119 type:complete len:286 (-) Transcript_13540:183-1040(-)|eukprot:CAMPEP_0203654722 /NCGR_PEP_ID=MMETSP0088-20131115/36096_1 /ASSEMBLY_ACC=CAM_ASM_001087 /TAXON_ID=426623 /ORGANISM="Chaetoceros affinis, Strain CCMP159" /LENGTH=285 /DNA_ID=CAMNT_0050515099 /DNA_START=74 /DNA_END=931 /DNA_ORIENTATION=-
MAKSILTLGIAALAACADATTVSVLELGKGGVVHRTNGEAATSNRGIMSFWKSTHEAGSEGQPRKERTNQMPGMNVVPDLFNRADGGVVVGIVGDSVNLDSMPTVAGIIAGEGTVANLKVQGDNGRKLMGQLSSKAVSATEFESVFESKAKASISSEGNKLESVFVTLDEKNEAADVDASLSRLLKQISKEAESNGSTIVVHLVVDDAASRRRLDGNADDGDDKYADTYQEYGYKTMFQIQYFNVVLWTSIGLFMILFTANYMVMFMPLMPDTLLFGESAKMVAE